MSQRRRCHPFTRRGTYWYNYALQVTSIDVPAELPAEMAAELEREEGTYFFNAVSREATWDEPAQATWREAVDPEGRTYFYHAQARLCLQSGLT